MMKRREESWSGSLPGGLQGLWTGTGCVLHVTTLTRVLQGRTWKPLLTEEHIHAWINVAKTLQSLPKASGAVCSALMKPRPNVLARIPREQSHSEAGWGSFPSAGSRAFIAALGLFAARSRNHPAELVWKKLKCCVFCTRGG